MKAAVDYKGCRMVAGWQVLVGRPMSFPILKIMDGSKVGGAGFHCEEMGKNTAPDCPNGSTGSWLFWPSEG